jgi:hypothetical protein
MTSMRKVERTELVAGEGVGSALKDDRSGSVPVHDMLDDLHPAVKRRSQRLRGGQGERKGEERGRTGSKTLL